MKVLQLTNIWPSEENPQYGAFVKAQIDSLRRYGNDLEIDVVGITESGGIGKYFELRKRLKHRLRQDRPAIIHIHYGYTALAVMDICRKERIPTLISYCGSDIYGAAGSLKRRLRYAVWARLSMLAGYAADRCIVKTDEMFNILPKALRKKTQIIPNGVNTGLFSLMEKRQAREKLGWGDDPVVLFAGRPENPQKNYALAKQAIDIVRGSIPDLRFCSPKDVPHSDMRYYLNAADILLLTSLKEGSSNIVKETMACNTPIVAVPVGDVSWLLDDVNNCFVVKYDASSIADAIERIVQNRCQRSNGRNMLLAKQLDDESVSKKIVDIYDNIVQERTA